ncbi:MULTISPECIES: cold-shock protein [Rhodococcus]|uniref:cold-shock protein n=1 Tax=Rhodococcus TaxID=1827 RepID=UPI0021769EA0|nr:MULTISPECIES: cold shock domain-containing protein [Rhodococcus]
MTQSGIDLGGIEEGRVAVARGVIKWFNGAKGFGFIAPDGGGDLFVEHTDIECSNVPVFQDDQDVDFDVGVGPKRCHARRVRRL